MLIEILTTGVSAHGKFNFENFSHTLLAPSTSSSLSLRLYFPQLNMAPRGSRSSLASNTVHGTGHGTPTDRGHGGTAAVPRGRGHPIPEKVRKMIPRAKANTHPGQIVNDNKQQRRTSEQVQEDNKRATAAAAATRDANERVEREKIQRVADAEDKLRKEDIRYKSYAMRPDLHSSKGKDTG